MKGNVWVLDTAKFGRNSYDKEKDEKEEVEDKLILMFPWWIFPYSHYVKDLVKFNELIFKFGYKTSL